MLGAVHAELWLGKNGLPRVMELQARLEEQRSRNEAARARNEQLVAEVRDLREGLEMVEEKAQKLTEIVELPRDVHPWYMGVQFHPEFKSTPWGGHPLFNSYIKAALDHQSRRQAG